MTQPADFRLAGWLAVAAATAACGHTTEPTRPAAVVVTPLSDTLLPGAERQLTARIVDDAGDTTDAPGVVWSSSAPDIAWVSADGTVTGVRLGTAAVTALVSDAQGSAQIRVQRPFSASMVAVGPRTVCALDLAGQAWCLGYNSRGELGIGNAGVPQPGFSAPVAGGHRFTTIGVRGYAVCALDTVGTAWCWGENDASELGHAPLSSTLPVVADTIRTYDTLAVGSETCGLAAGETYCWGNTFPTIAPPRKLGISQVFRSITTGFSGSCGITANGLATCWHVQQGDYRSYPPSGAALAQVAIGSSFRCLVFADGVGGCDGSNASGQLGNGTTTDATAPVLLPGAWKTLTAGDNSACGLSPDGTALCWGGNESGQLGTGDSTASLIPIAVATTRRFRMISTAAWNGSGARIHRTCGITTADELLCWGADLPARPAQMGY